MIRNLVRRLLGRETPLEKYRRTHARVHCANAAYAAKVMQERAIVPRPVGPFVEGETNFREIGIGDLPRPIYPNRPDANDRGTASGQLAPHKPFTSCAWSLEHCAEEPASEIGYCTGHLRRILGASVPEVTG